MNYWSESRQADVDIDTLSAPHLLNAIAKMRRLATTRPLNENDKKALEYMLARANREGEAVKLEQEMADGVADLLAGAGVGVGVTPELVDAIVMLHEAELAAAVKAERELSDAAWEVFKQQEPLLADRPVKYLEWAFPETQRATQDPNGRVAWVIRYRKARALLTAAKPRCATCGDRIGERC